MAGIAEPEIDAGPATLIADGRFACVQSADCDPPALPLPPPVQYYAFDVYDADVCADEEPPFDPPDERDPLGAEDCWFIEAPAPPPLKPPPLRVAPKTRTVAIEARNLDYIEQARRAARSFAEANKYALNLQRMKKSQIGASVAAGLAMPLILGGAWLLTAPRDGAPRELVTAAAAETPAETLQPAAQRHKQEYDAALRLLDAGRARESAARMHRLASAGYALAQYRVSKFYEHGLGAPRDLSQARAWAERAARGGNCRAMHDLGVYFARGEGAPRNEALAFRWFREAADYGVADSQYNLALLYEQGRGVTANAEEALFWYLVAAHHGDSNAADRAVALAAGIAPEQITQIRARALAFQTREPDAAANG